jgi:hypothetical protein
MMEMIDEKEHLNESGLRLLFQLKQLMHWARVVREIRSLRGNGNSKFFETIRPSTQGSWEYPKSAVWRPKVSSMTGSKS